MRWGRCTLRQSVGKEHDAAVTKPVWLVRSCCAYCCEVSLDLLRFFECLLLFFYVRGADNAHVFVSQVTFCLFSDNSIYGSSTARAFVITLEKNSTLQSLDIRCRCESTKTSRHCFCFDCFAGSVLTERHCFDLLYFEVFLPFVLRGERTLCACLTA